MPLSNAGLTENWRCKDPATSVRPLEVMGLRLYISFLPLDEAVASRAVFIIVPWSDGWAETLLEPDK